MKWSPGGVGSAIERDLRRLQMLLPFPDEKTIDMKRCCSILHVSRPVIDKLRATPLPNGSGEMCLNGYNTMRCAPVRIDYDSLVRFLDYLREFHAIPDRRPPAVFGRHRDEDLLPFRWSDTIRIEHAAELLSIHPSNVLTRIEAGQFHAYQIMRGSPWRISSSSLAEVIAGFGSAPRSTRQCSAAEAESEVTL